MMKLTFSLLLISLASIAMDAVSQTTRINLVTEESTIVEIFQQIEESSDIGFFFKNEQLDLTKRYSVNFENKTVEEILGQLLGENYSYSHLGKTIVITKNENAKRNLQQEKKIQGIVSNADGVGIPGVTIIVKGTTVGTITDFDGNYSLTNVPGNATLVFSFVGMITQEIAIDGRTTINTVMEEDAIGIEEVVAIGYGSIKKSDLTGAVSSVGNKDLTAYPSTNVVEALQGRAAGVSVQSTNGEPGGGFKINIRGATSINASSNPLFVVDGLVGGSVPPPEDIASIEILKDASSTAIYGSRGANGVVMITTKTGEKGAPKVNLKSSYSFQKEIGRLEVLNAREFAEYINEARDTEFYDLNALSTDTDWQELVFQPGHLQNHQISLSGGSDRVQYYVSGVFYDQKGVIKTSAYNRYSLTTNLNVDVTDFFRVKLNSLIQTAKQNGVLTQTGGGVHNSGVITAAQRFDPTLGVIDENGVYTKSQVGIAAHENPLAGIDGRDEENKFDYLQLSVKAEVDLAKGLIFNSTFGTNIRNTRNGVYDSRITNLGEGSLGHATLSYTRNFNFLTEQYFVYDFNLGDINKFVLTSGYSYQKFLRETFRAENSGFITDALGYWNLGVGTNLLAPSSGNTQSEIASLYGRLNYNFDERFLLTFTARYDGASQFSEGNKWSFFPSGAISWNVNNEEFWPENNLVSALKLRTSYGLTGNQAISAYQSLARIGSSFFVLNNTSVSAVRPTTIANKDLTWETTSQFDVGLDVELLNRRINLGTDYYYKKTDDLLFNVPIPSFSGYQSRLENLGKIENKGFEFQLTSRNLINQFKWSTSLNLTLNRNKVLSLPGGVDIIYASAPSNIGGRVDSQILREGEPVGSFYGYVYEGVYQDGDTFLPGGDFDKFAGGEKYADMEADGVLDSKDRTIIGNPNPKAIWGLNNDFSYKGFSLNIFLQAYTGGDMMNLVKMEMDRLSGNSNATKDALNRWTPENTDTDIPKAAAGRTSKVSSRFVEDGSYLRVKNISLSYDLSRSILAKAKISSARIYLSGQNLFTLTNYSGVDPEVAYLSSNTNIGLDYGSYPNTTSFTLGLNLGF